MLLVACFAGCTVASSAGLYPQSHFSYPRSVVIPIGPTRGEATKTAVFFPAIMDGTLKQEAIQIALQAGGGDILINYVQTTKVVYIPIPFFPIYTTTLTVDGIAAKMELGSKY
jgi:hypothetical protein